MYVPQLCKLWDHAHLSICCILSQNSIVWMTMCAMVVHVLHSSFRLSIVFMIAISSAPLSMPPPMWKLLSGILCCEELFVSLISIGLSKKKKKTKFCLPECSQEQVMVWVKKSRMLWTPGRVTLPDFSPLAFPPRGDVDSLLRYGIW